MRKLGFAPLADAPDATAPRRWQLERQAWLARGARSVAPEAPNC